jgi:hypothetical protein
MSAPYVTTNFPLEIPANKKVEKLYPGSCRDKKDICVVEFRGEWLLYGSGGISANVEQWKVLLAIADNPYGPFELQPPVALTDQDGNDFYGPQLCAPAVTFDPNENSLIMTIQEACFELGGSIQLFKSKDGTKFEHQTTIIKPTPEFGQLGTYDPHHSIIKTRDSNGKVIGETKVCLFTGINRVGLGNVNLIETTNSWNGGWVTRGCVLNASQVAEHHNQDDDPNREWCVEGEQLLELDESIVKPEVYERYGKRPIYILNAVGFYPSREDYTLELGTRQHNFFAASFNYAGDFQSLGPLHPYSKFKEAGHGTLIHLPDECLGLYRQERNYNPMTKQSGPWRYVLDIIDPNILYQVAVERLLMPVYVG